MKKLNNFSFMTAFSIAIVVAMIGSTLFVGGADAQLYPAGYGGYDYPGIYGDYGMPASYGTPVNYGVPAYGGQQTPYAGGNVAQSASAGDFLTIQGLEGLQGFGPGQNRMSLAVIPVSQQGSQLGFQVIGFAITSPDTGAATVYALKTPLPGVIDPSQSTLQVDLSNLDSAVQQAGYIGSDQVYDTIRSDPQVIVIDVDMTYQGAQGYQTIFNVNAVDVIPASGQMQAFAMQQPTQLIIDAQNLRLYMVVFPEMINTFTSYYGAAYPQVLPIVYAQPIPVFAPVYTPYLTPYPIFFTNFVGFNPFYFGSGFVSFYNFNAFNGRFPIHDRTFGHAEFNQFNRNVVRAGAGAGGRITGPGNIGAGVAPGNLKPGNIGAGIGAGTGGRITTPGNVPNIQKPGNIGAGISGAGAKPGNTGKSGNIGAGMGAGMNIKPAASGKIASGGGSKRMGGGRR